jgi:ketosteroid isomerase-like protein
MDHEELMRRLYANFNARDAEAVLAQMTADVDWPNAWEGGRLVGREAVREYWLRQWAEIDAKVEPTGFELRRDGSLAVSVHQVVRNLDGELLSEQDLRHVYVFRDGLVAAMTVEE